MFNPVAVSAPARPQAQNSYSMFARIVPNPTGRNGYEEYLRAADFTMRDDFRAYSTWWNAMQTGELDESFTRPFNVSPKDNDLMVRRKWADRFAICTQLIATGNQKAVFEPRTNMDMATIFPEYASFKTLAKFEAMAARVSFADGLTAEGIHRLEQLFLFSRNIGCSILISHLVGLACDSIAFRELDQHWPQYNLSDAQEIESFMGQLLKAPSTLGLTFEKERQYGKYAAGLIAKKPQEFWKGIGGDEQDTKFGDTLSHLSQDELNKQMDDLQKGLDQYYDKIQGIIGSPEKSQINFAFDQLDPASQGGKPSLGNALVSMIVPTIEPTIIAEEAMKTRIRIAYLNAKAVEYRWLHGKLPERIEQFASASERIDPTTGAVFIYQPDGNWFQIRRDGKDALQERLYPPVHPKEQAGQPQP